MTSQEIQPHRVTRPFQLLAAWFVTLIALDATYLTGASMIKEPTWVAGLLSIAAVAYVPIFILSMFLLQTRFRPQMQDDPYYSVYVKREQEKSQEIAVKLTESMNASGLDIESIVTEQRKLSDLPEAIKSEIKSLLENLQRHVSSESEMATKSMEPDPTTILALAKGFLAQQRWLEAGREFERYAHQRFDDWEASYARGVAFSNARGGYLTNLSALRAYNDSIAYAHESSLMSHGRLFAYRGAILKRLNRLDEAEADLNIAHKRASTDEDRIDVAYNLACIYALTGRRDEMLSQIRIISEDRGYLIAVREHLHDYFTAYRNDRELLRLIGAEQRT